MMSRAPRWNDTVVNTKISKATHKKLGKDLPVSSAPASSKQGGSTKTSVGRSHSLGSRGGDGKASLKGGGGGSSGGLLATRQASHRGRQALRLCSSRSFSSLPTSSLTAATFMRNSRSLSRLDQRSTGEDSDPTLTNSPVKRIQATGKRILNSAHRSSSVEHIREKTEQRYSDHLEKMKTSTFPQRSESSSNLVSAADPHKGKKQSRDGVYTLCAMTSGMRRNWVQAVLKNVRPALTHEDTSSHAEQKVEPQPQPQTSGRREDLYFQHQEQKTKSILTNRSPPSPPLPVSPSESSAPSLTNPSDQEEESNFVHQSPQTKFQGDYPAFTMMLSNDECFPEDSNVQTTAEQSSQHAETDPQTEEHKPLIDILKNTETLPSEPQTAELVKELEQTQRELSRLQQLNRNLQDELQQEKESRSKEWVFLQDDNSSSSDQALAFQQLQKVNYNLHLELEAQKRIQEEAREAELRRRVDLLAQQAQLLVTGDATALAQAHLEQDRRRFQEQQVQWEQRVDSLKSQLNLSEEQRKEAESRFTQLQEELQSYQNLQQEAEQLRKHLEDVSTQFHDYEEAQVEKEGQLQKHLTVLQTSQERERKSLAASLAKTEQHSKELQERLDRAEEQVESFQMIQASTQEIEEAQRQLQEELARTISAVQQLQDERDQLDHRCQELQNQLSEADREGSRLQGRLKTDETQYYNLEHSYERVCEELQVALGKVQQMEADTQEIREGYERLLDRKEQELSEVLLKMEVLGNSLEETEVKLNEVLKVCSCASSQQQNQSQTAETVSIDDSRTKLSNSQHVIKVDEDSLDCARTRSRSIDASYKYFLTAADDPERFMSAIQSLETKLYVTEEKLRDITQRLEEHQSHASCQDPQLCSQLTQSRANAQHLSLQLHTQAKQSQRFAQEAENRCRMLVGRFQVALNIIQACRERLHITPINLSDLERQLTTVAACLQQGEKEAEKQQHESRNASKGEGKILKDEKAFGAGSDGSAGKEDLATVGKCLKRELFIVEKMVSALQSPNVIRLLSSISQKDESDLGKRYRNIISQRIALKTEKTAEPMRTESNSSEHLLTRIGRVCAEAELIHAALNFETQENNQQVEYQREGLADISPSELATYEEQVQVKSGASGEASTQSEKDQPDDRKVDAEKEPEWLERLILRLQRRHKFLRLLCQDDNGAVSESWENGSSMDLFCIQEQAKLIYLSDRLYLDLEQEFQQVEVLQNKVRALTKEEDMCLMDEQEAFNHTLCQLQEHNNTLRDELDQAKQKIASVETGNQRLLEDVKKIEDYHEEQIQTLENKFQEKIRELQQIHEEEMKDFHGYYTKSCVSKEKEVKPCTETPALNGSTSSPLDQTLRERKTNEDTIVQWTGGDSEALREAYQKDLDKLKESCDQEVSAMEEMHRKMIGELHQQHQKEVAKLQKEKDQILQEETAATMAAIVAMRRAHKQELEKSRRSQRIRESADITQLCAEYEKEIQLLHKELEMLSVQHTEKCLENSQLGHELQEERQSVVHYQAENQELRKKQREGDEMPHNSLNGKQIHVAPQVNDFYEMEVILRAREAEMHFLRHEACSLREELKIARMDKIYAQNKLKALCTNNQDEALPHVNTLSEDFQFSSWDASREPPGQSMEDSVSNTHNNVFSKKIGKSSFMRQIKGVRSKSLKEGLSMQERSKLFESF